MKFRLWHIFLIIGLSFLVLALMFLPIAISGMVGLDDSGSGEVIGLFSMIFCFIPAFVPTAIFLVLAVLFRARLKKLAELAEMLRSYRVITMSDLARKIGRREHRVRNAVKLCMKRGLIDGKFDEVENAFVTREYIDKEPGLINGWKCSSCGNYNKKIVLPGEVAKCDACGVILERTSSDKTPTPLKT
jgi:hypothetical protein